MRRRTRRRRSARQPTAGRAAALTGWGFAAPFVILFGVFLLVPILASLVLASRASGSATSETWCTTEFVGLDNYTKLFGDELFWKRSRNTAYFVVVGVPLTVGVGLCSPRALNQGIAGCARLFRVGYYLPVVTSIVAIAVIWRYLLEPDVGLVNIAARQGRDRRAELARRPDARRCRRSSRWASGATSARRWSSSSPRCRRSIPQLYEAAAIDGAEALADLPPRDGAAAPAGDPVRGRHHHRSATCRCSRSRS